MAVAGAQVQASPPPNVPAVVVRRCHHPFPRRPQVACYTAAERITLDFKQGEFVAIVGPSGCGKSTLLNAAAGFAVSARGTVRIFGEELGGINPDATYMFQGDALLPWRTVIDNVCLGLSFRGVDPKEARELGMQWIDRVGLTGFENHFPHQLSGGDAQARRRVRRAGSSIRRYC